MTILQPGSMPVLYILKQVRYLNTFLSLHNEMKPRIRPKLRNRKEKKSANVIEICSSTVYLVDPSHIFVNFVSPKY